MKAARDWAQSEGICFKQNEENWCSNQSTSLDLRLYPNSCDPAVLGVRGAPLASGPWPLLWSLTDLCPQVPPHTPEASGVPGQPASPPELKRRLPTQPSDHSYALLDLDALKKKLFLTLKENEKLRRRLKAQRLVMRRMCSQLRARLAGRPGLQARPLLGQQS